MTATTTLMSLSSSKQNLRELCANCESQPYDIVCICGEKFDFKCIQRHIEQIGHEFNKHYQQVGENLTKMNSLRGKENNQFGSLRTVINNWKQKRLQDINDIAEQALSNSERQDNIPSDISRYQEIYGQLSNDLHKIGHDSLNNLIELKDQIEKYVVDIQNPSTTDYNDAILDATLQAKLQPSVTLTNLSSIALTNRTNQIDLPTDRVETRNSFVSHSSFSTSETVAEPIISITNSTARIEEPVSKIDTSTPIEQIEPYREMMTESTMSNINAATSLQSSGELTNGVHETENTSSDEFDCGKTGRIQRSGAIIIPTTSEKYAGTICCHDNQLIYNAYDKTTRSSALVFISDVTNLREKKSIDWHAPLEPIDAADDKWIQDIVYSNELSGYLILNRARLRLYKADTNILEEFHPFVGRTMKRVSCCEKFIYLTSIHGSASCNGDEIIIMNSNKEELVCKTLRDILPAKVNRGAGALAGEISDITVSNNTHVTIGYRLERRHEVGVCVFSLTNNGKDWSCTKQLVLNDCWHSDLSYTPRIDWSDKLQVFILIEYITGHLIMIDTDGQVEGECRFMQVQNRRDSPINLTVSEGWLGVRYDTSITIHKITA
ncbi:hypothetical protein I4U23_018498 [Adineta vaga]|nr:hypothetical protein I4U23_018498 [Adineta vaga]